MIYWVDESNGKHYNEMNYTMKKPDNQTKINAFPNLDKLSKDEKIQLYDRYFNEIKGFAKHLVKSSADALKSIKEQFMLDQSSGNVHRALDEIVGGDGVTDIHRKLIEKKAEEKILNEEANTIIIDSAMIEIKRLQDCNTDLRIRLSTLMSLTPVEALEIKSTKLYRKQKKKIKKFKSLVKKLNIEVFELRHMGDKTPQS